MRPANQTTESRALRYTIGAGIMVLALMLFSQLSCSILGYCADWFGLPVLGFWEVLAIATGLLVSLLAARILFRSRATSLQLSLSAVTPEFDPGDLPLSDVEPVESALPLRRETIQERTRERWQAFCERLSDEEKRSLRSLLEQKVLSSRPPSGSSSSPTDLPH